MLASLAVQASPGELAGEAAARFVFASGASPAGVSHVARRSARRRLSCLPARVGAWLVATLAAATVGLGGAAAAYADVLPGSLQDLAHHAIGAPAARPASHPTPHPAKPGTAKPRKPGNAKAAGQKAHAEPQPAQTGMAEPRHAPQARHEQRRQAQGQARKTQQGQRHKRPS
jgi:hypothetical protein